MGAARGLSMSGAMCGPLVGYLTDPLVVYMGLEPTDLVRINEEVVRVNWVRAITCQRIATSYGLDEPVCGTSVGLLLDSDEHQS